MSKHETATALHDFNDRPADEVAKSLDEYPNDLHNDPDDLTITTPPPAPQWRPAASLCKLRDQINAKFPNRKKDSDGTIGNAAHCPGSSDHCPNIIDGDVGVVTGMDITHDPPHGLDSGAVAEKLRVSQDPRIKYIISNRRIANYRGLAGKPPFAWRPYNGANPHDKHFHLSVKTGKTGPGGYDTTADWSI
jgi:hypothetical protein